MTLVFLGAAGLALLVWVGVLLAPARAFSTRERLELIASPGHEPTRPRATQALSDVTVLIPARDEAASIGRVLASLKAQGAGLEVIVIDDHSCDGTAAVAAAAAWRVAQPVDDAQHVNSPALSLRILPAAALPPGWGGKLWALQQGLDLVSRRYTLLLDADIELAPGALAMLLERARAGRLALVSVMAELACESFWERLLVPAFVFFFKLIYPFARVNDRGRRAAAAAGGCMLVETPALRAVGAFAAFRDALIDDCTLARRLKRAGYGIWLGLSKEVRSLRRYAKLDEFWLMVSRTAFTQLGYSVALLVGVTLAMLVVFVAPIAALTAGPDIWTRGVAVLALAAMCAVYTPLVRFYGLRYVWSASLPLAAMMFLLMTWTSALRYWRGVRATWKNRIYEASR
jgi:hopene-associated glycosyltransferase HpnB